MGLDLSMLPVDHESSTVIAKKTWGYSHQVLACDLARDLYDAITSMPQTPIPDDFSSYLSRLPDGEHGYGKTKETPYGEPITCVTVAELLTLSDSDAVRQSPQNRAVWAFLNERPHTQRIALYWR